MFLQFQKCLAGLLLFIYVLDELSTLVLASKWKTNWFKLHKQKQIHFPNSIFV